MSFHEMPAGSMLPVAEVDPGRSSLSRVAFAVGAVALVAAADIGLGRLRWPRSETTISFVEEGPDTDTLASSEAGGETGVQRVYPAGEVCLVVPGLGCESAQGAAEAIAPALDSRVAYLTFPQRKPSIEAAGAELQDFFTRNGIKKFGIFAHSMGGLVSLQLLEYLHKNGGLKTGGPKHNRSPSAGHESAELEYLTFDHTPTCMADTYASPTAPRLLSRSGYPGGFIGKMIGAAVVHHQRSTKENPATFQSYVQKVYEDALGPCASSANLWLWQLKQLCDATPEKTRELIQKYVPPETHVGYIRSEPHTDDVVVRVLQAIGNVRRYRGNAPVDEIVIPGIAHASPGQNPRAYQDGLRAWIGSKSAAKVL